MGPRPWLRRADFRPPHLGSEAGIQPCSTNPTITLKPFPAAQHQRSRPSPATMVTQSSLSSRTDHGPSIQSPLILLIGTSASSSGQPSRADQSRPGPLPHCPPPLCPGLLLGRCPPPAVSPHHALFTATSEVPSRVTRITGARTPALPPTLGSGSFNPV